MDFTNKRVIVTGGAGVIGRELVAKLDALGAHVRVFDLEPKPAVFSSRVDYVQKDLSYLNRLEFVKFDPQVIFHLAATFERSTESLGFWEINWQNEMTLNHLVNDAARYCKILEKFIFASSYLIYDPELYMFQKRPAEATALRESDRMNPRNLCGMSKLYAEKELEYFSKFPKEYTFSSVMARIYRVYGQGSRDVISRWVRSALRDESLTVYMPENRFDYIFAGDVAEGLVKLAQSRARGVVNLGRGRAHEIAEVVDILKKHFPKLNVKHSRVKDLFEASCADMRKFQKLTGWLPDTSLATGIKKIIEYAR